MSETKMTLPGLLFKGLDNHPEGLFSSTKRDGTWHETDVKSFREKVRNFAMGLYDLGVRPGNKVSIHSENSTEWLVCDLAVLSLGAANVPIYTTQPGNQIKYILENSDSIVHIVSNDEMFAETKPLIKSIKTVKAVISIRESSHKKLKRFEDILERGKKVNEENPDLFDSLRNDVEPDQVATLIYTSGTTGMPKGVMLTHNNIASNVLASLERLPFDMSEFHGQRLLSYLPLSHVFERMIDYMYIRMGCRIYFIENIEEIRDDFLYVEPFFLATVPRLLEKIHTGVKVRGQEMSGLQKNIYYWAIYLTESYDPEHPPTGLAAVKHRIADKLVYSKIRDLFGGNLRGMVSGGAALSPEVFRFGNAIGLIVVQGYGLTETSPVISVQTPKDMRVGSSGKPLRDVEVKIADDGEILTRGPNVMKGYYKDEEKTNEVITSDGWFKTGDIGELDEDGNLFITDRKKSMFKLSTGKYVAPNHVEGEISGSGFIDQIVVIGYQRKFCSALIVPSYDNVKKRLKRDGYDPDEPYSKDPKVRELIQKEVDKHNQNLSPWETVKKFVLLEEPLTIDSGELTPTMKVKRPVVLEKYKEEIESMYEEE
ncbi:AMP-dependent synthetase/ligase [Rhodohalobacter mucosus]|uniref:Long-chain fatty acid--CoA ligase n=1 Tax=Rhodohalobacter mucosus TaxID=2079485 RepID=A0A316TPS4_9BACT|nr:long-chain fatty acid--CoA ligase [Rhodohalobacter mucosus]PWN06607.1 long-chain fatty acid--CoA ligase [Rhodohalobacter mucosus]